MPVTVETIENKDELKNSVNIVKSIFEDMADFQSNFWGIYNAYKHGFRLFVEKAKSEVIYSEGVSGDLDSFIMDSIIFIDRKGKKTPAIFFNRGSAIYHRSFFNLIQGIINAFNIKLVCVFNGCPIWDLSKVQSPSIRIFRCNEKCFDRRLICEFRKDDYVLYWQ